MNFVQLGLEPFMDYPTISDFLHAKNVAEKLLNAGKCFITFIKKYHSLELNN